MTEQLDLFETTQEEMVEEPKKDNESPLWKKSEAQIKEDNESFLTPRQWALYRLIFHNSMVEHRKTDQKEICEKVRGYEWNDDTKAHDHCVGIWTDVTANNLSMEHDHIIIMKRYTYWIGSENENKEFLIKLWNDLSGRLHRYWFYVKKIGMDGQGKIFDKNGNPVDENNKNVKMFHECFNNYDIEMQEYIKESKKEEKKNA